MDFLTLAKILFLLAVANGAPVAGKRLFGARFSAPMDFGARFIDGKPLLGSSKTWRGLIFSVVLTGLCAMPLGMGFFYGAFFAFFSMAGDIFSSFIKRRLGMPSSSMALGLDQLPESLFPLLAFYRYFSLTIIELSLVLIVFFVGELLVSRALYALHFRDRPY